MTEEEEKPSPSISPIEGLKALSEATVDSLSEMMNRDPFDMTIEHVRNIVTFYRQQRARWAVAELVGKRSLPKAKPPAAPAAPKDMDF